MLPALSLSATDSFTFFLIRHLSWEVLIYLGWHEASSSKLQCSDGFCILEKEQYRSMHVHRFLNTSLTWRKTCIWSVSMHILPVNNSSGCVCVCVCVCECVCLWVPMVGGLAAGKIHNVCNYILVIVFKSNNSSSNWSWLITQ